MINRKIFEVVTARASASEQCQLIDGIVSQAFKYSTDIIVISNIYNASEYNDFIKLEDSIYDLISSKKPDGIIFTEDAFINLSLRHKVISMIKETGIPFVCAGSDESGAPFADNCVADDVEKITDHLIEVHGFREIDLITGPEKKQASYDRVNGYKRSVLNHNMSYSDDNVIFGDFWTVSGLNTAELYLSGKRRMPEAVICANDYTAYGLCDALIKNGVRVPDDITVMGYEHTGDRASHYPVLSTYRRNRRALGQKIFMMLYGIVNGIDIRNDISLDGEIIFGDTCSCRTDIKQYSEEIEELHNQQFYSMLNDTGMLEQFLTESRNISDFIAALKRHSYFIPDLSGLYLCLYEDWCISSDRKKKHSGSDDMICYTISDAYTEGFDSVHFNRSEIIPESVRRIDNPDVYYCCPVFFMEEEFGYMIVRYNRISRFGESYKNWIKIVSNALEFLRMKNDIDYLMQCQNLSDFHDSVTGLSNMEGFMNELKIAVRNADSSCKVLIIMIRINDYSETFMNDTEQIERKNEILKGIGEVLRTFSAGRGRVCGRTGEKTFAFAVVDYDSEICCDIFAERLNILVNGYLRQYNIFGPDFICSSSYFGVSSETDFSYVMEFLKNEIKTKTAEINSGKTHSDYSGYMKLRHRIYNNPSEDISASEACRIFCLSSGHFRAMYRTFFGVSFHQECISFKIMLAKYLLLSTRMTIASIAEKCGYENDKYFMQQFKLVSGFTPNQYRELQI